MGVVGSIAITDRVSGVLKNIRNEQTAFRKDVTETRKELNHTWGKTYKAKVDTKTAVEKVTAFLGKAKQVGKTAISPVLRVKDAASGTITKVADKAKAIGKKAASPVIKAKDKASAVLSKVSGKLKAVSKVFTPIIKVRDMTAKGISAIGGKLKSLAKSVAIPVTIAAATATMGIVGGSVSEGAKLEQSTGGVETLFKGDAGTVKANADKAFETAGLSANDYMEQVTSFSASLLNSLGGDTAKAASVADQAMVDMADNANKFGTDIGSIQNAYQGFAKQNYTMLDNLKLGYGGTKEEMQRLLKDAGKLSGVTYDIDNLADVYNAIHTIQEKLDVAGTTAKEASTTFSGSFGAMKSAVKNLMGYMATGGDVEGAVASVVETASTFLFKNAVPMIGRVAAALPKALKTGIKAAAPKIKESGKEVVKSIKDGIVGILPSSMGGVADQIFESIGNLGSGFSSVIPQLSAFGTAMAASLGQTAAACIPVLTSIITTVQTMLPVILPVIQNVVSTIGGLIAQAAPVISGLISSIGEAVTTLAPVFNTIFTEIGEKVSTVIDFVSERMGFIEQVISTAAPAISTVLETAWSVISPIMDLAISVFELIFSVVQRVFPGVQSVLESVWGAVQPIVEGIGSAIEKVANWISSTGAKISGGGGSGGSGSVGKNAEGDNNWRGGLTWVGEKGPELVDLPRGSRILPNKESVSLTRSAVSNVVRGSVSRTAGEGPTGIGSVLSFLSSIDQNLAALAERIHGKGSGLDAPGQNNHPGISRGFLGSITIQLAKLADTINVRSAEDIDELAEQVAKKFVEVIVNMG